MKKSMIVLPFISLFTCMVVSFGFSNPIKKKVGQTKLKQGFAVVELFTSEGCSSCPPADEAVAALAKEYPANVYILGYHVDYWNYLGWKDDFSSADYTGRQQQYAAVFNLNSIYTPQVVVNGETEFTGSDKRKLYASVLQELGKQTNTDIAVTAKSSSPKEVVISCTAKTDTKTILQVALVQLQAVSAVKRGENSGKQLHHIDVVRGFKTINSNTGSVSITIPSGLTAKDCKVIVFAQDKTDMHITGAAESAIE